VLSNSIQRLSDHTILFACDHKWPTGSARTHTDVSVKWPNISNKWATSWFLVRQFANIRNSHSKLMCTVSGTTCTSTQNIIPVWWQMCMH